LIPSTTKKKRRNSLKKVGVVSHAYTTSYLSLRQEDLKFEVSLGYILETQERGDL
jgi:hypothetical protein